MSDPANTSPLPSLLHLMVTAGARHLVTGLAGGLIAAGALQQGQQEQFVAIASGIVVWLAGYAWSYLNKKAAKAATAPTP